MLVNQKEAIILLKKGNVVGIPTDTVYGFAALEKYQYKIYQLKKRHHHKPLITMVSDINRIAKVDLKLKRMMIKNWPGKVTFIFQINNSFKSYRIPNQGDVLSLLKTANLTIKTSSANISGQQPITNEKQFVENFPNIACLKNNQKLNISCVPSEIFVYNKGSLFKIR